jgi:Ser/Thr protein kinase RdoA (MazF antagonist)
MFTTFRPSLSCWRVHRFLTSCYGFKAVQIEEVHVAFGVAIRFSHAGESYYLKFTGRANHRRPDALFRLWRHLRHHAVPLPVVLKGVHGAFFENILEASPYDVTYVMKALPGRVMIRKTARRLDGFVNVMAAFHRLGADYRPRVYAASRNVCIYFQEARESLEGVGGLPTEQRELLARTLAYTYEALTLTKAENALSKTHVHGDFRFCHVLFEGDRVAGVIDAEHAEHAERVFDVCMGLVSHADPARCLLLDLNEILGCLRHYDELYPFNEADRRALKAMMLCALLNELSGFVGTGRSKARGANARKLWRVLAEVERLPDELSFAS